MKIAILGSNSFSGSHLIDLLFKKGMDIIGLSRSSEKGLMDVPYKQSSALRYRFYQINSNKTDEIMKIFDSEKPNKIINFASQSEVEFSWNRPEDWYRTNVLGLVSLTNELKKRKYLERYIHISTPEVYGSCSGYIKEDTPYNPTTPYAASRTAGDIFLNLLFKNFDFPVSFVCSSNVYGSYQQLFKIIPRTIIYSKINKKLQMHDGGNQIRSFVHIKDVCEGIFKILENSLYIGETFHFSSNPGIPLKDIIEMIYKKLNTEFEDAVEISKQRRGQDKIYTLDSSKARCILNWKEKISLSDGIDDVIDWINDNWDYISNSPHEYIHKQ